VLLCVWLQKVQRRNGSGKSFAPSAEHSNSSPNPTGNELVPLENEDYPDDAHEDDLLKRCSRRSGMLLNSDELVCPNAGLRRTGKDGWCRWMLLVNRPTGWYRFRHDDDWAIRGENQTFRIVRTSREAT
jgi:hypothetical protein